jgi:hypothetical protein
MGERTAEFRPGSNAMVDCFQTQPARSVFRAGATARLAARRSGT